METTQPFTTQHGDSTRTVRGEVVVDETVYRIEDVRVGGGVPVTTLRGVHALFELVPLLDRQGRDTGLRHAFSVPDRALMRRGGNPVVFFEAGGVVTHMVNGVKLTAMKEPTWNRRG